MKIYQGRGACGGIAVGKIMLLRRKDAEVRYASVEDTAREKARFERARERAALELQEIYRRTRDEVGKAGAEIFEIHRMMLEDGDYNDYVNGVIQDQSANAEYAAAVTADHFAELFAAADDIYLKSREADLRDITRRLIRILSDGENREWGIAEEAVFGGGSRDGGGEEVILCAEDLAPSETVSLGKGRVSAFVTAGGSVNSHTAILARSIRIPAVTGAGYDFLEEIREGDEAIVDGDTGQVFVNPDGKTREELLKRQQADREKERLLQELKGKENRTLDGRRIDIYANIEGPDDISGVLDSDAGGIGLFRSEFLYLGRDDYPAEEEQFKAYKRVLESMAGREVLVRTLDMGADKQADYFHLRREENPALGCRGIRLCLARPEIFQAQLRALFRASVYGNLGIMFPMITSVAEVERILSICAEVKKDLQEKGVPVSEEVRFGIMIETPAAAVISDRLAPMVDFFSVGTNDLIQYTLACDRRNSEVEAFADPHHEAVLRLIEMSAANAHKHGVRIGICGELGADTSLTETFLRMGIDELSVAPALVLKVREKVRSLELREPSG